MITLAGVIANTGIAYEKVREQVEATLQANQRSTTFSNTQQARALTVLIALTGTYEKGLRALQPAMDLATGLGLDLESTTRLISQGIEGNLQSLGRYIPALRQTNIAQFELMTIEQRAELVLGLLEQRFGGLAELVGKHEPYVRLKNVWADFLVVIGNVIIKSPVVNALLEETIRLVTELTDATKKSSVAFTKNIEIQLKILDVIESVGLSIAELIDLFRTIGHVASAVWNVINVGAAAVGHTITGVSLQYLEFARNLSNIPFLSDILGLNTVVLDEQIETAKEFLDIWGDQWRDAAKGLQADWKIIVEQFDGGGPVFKATKESFDKIRESVKNFKDITIPTKEGVDGLGDGLKGLAGDAEKAKIKIEDLSKPLFALVNFIKGSLLFPGFTRGGLGILGAFESFIPQFFKEEIPEAIKETTDTIQAQTLLWADYFADTFAQIRNSFVDFVVDGLFEGFKNIQQGFKALLRTLLSSFLQFATALASQKLVLNFGGSFGAQGEGGGFGNLLSSVGGLFGSAPTTGFNAPAIGGHPPPTGTITGAGGFGATLGAGLLGFTIGQSIGQLIVSNPTGLQQGISAGLGVGGAVAGGILFGPIGAAAGGFLGSIIGSFIGLFFKKDPPQLNIVIGKIKEETGNRAATFGELLTVIDDTTSDFAEDLIRIRTGGITSFGGHDKIRQDIANALKPVIDQIRGIIATLPSDLAKTLDDLLLSTELNTQKLVLEFHNKGEKLAKEFQGFLAGEVGGELIFALDSFFSAAFTALGVGTQQAEDFVNQQLEQFKKVKGRENRAKFAQEFLGTFNAYVDAFNFLNDNLNDVVNTAIQQVQSLSQDLGFEGIPTINQLKDSLRQLIATADIDPDVIKKFADLRNAIISMTSALVSAITGIASFIDELNAKIVSLGGGSVDTSGAIRTSIQATQGILSQGGLSLEEREALLRQMSGAVDQLLAQGQQNIEAQQLQAQAELEAQRTFFEIRISGLEKEKTIIQDQYRTILALAELAQSIRENIQSLLLGPSSILTATQRLAFAQEEINDLFSQLGTATDENKVTIGRQIQDLLNQVIGIGGEAFQQPSLEFRDTFRGVIEQLEDLQALIGPTRSIEEINAEMDAKLASIDRQIEVLRQQSASLQQRQIEISNIYAQEARMYYEYIRQEAVKILEARLVQLQELGIGNLENLTSMEAIGVEQLTVLRQIAMNTAGGTAIAAQHGFEGIVRTPTRFIAGEGSQPEFVSVRPVNGGSSGSIPVVFNFTFNGEVSRRSGKDAADEFIRLVSSNSQVRRVLGLN